LGRRLWWGAAVKQAREVIGGMTGSAVAGDAGLLYSPAGWPVTFGGGVRNLGGKASFPGAKATLPRLVDGGMSGRFFSGAVVAALEGHASAEGFFWNAGLELWAHNLLAFRVGMDSHRDTGAGLTWGLGVRLKRVRVDYAMLPEGAAFGNSHRVSLAYRFGGGGEAPYQEGLSLAQQGDHAAAILKFKEALDADPDHAGAARGLKDSIRALDEERSRR
jgi:hypothetical protein